MPSTNNYIEEFFISIGFDTNKVKKQAKEIDKVLNGLEKRKSSAVSKEVKEKQKLYKLQRQSEADNFKFFLKQEKGKQKATKDRYDAEKTAIQTLQAQRRKQAVGSLTAKTGVHSAKDSASVFQSQFKIEDEIKKAEAIKDKRQRERYIKRKKHRASLAKDRLKEEAKVNSQAEKALKDRLRIYKAEKKAQAMSIARKESFEDMGKAIRSGDSYRRLQSTGRSGNFDSRIDKAVSEQNKKALRELRREIGSTSSATRGLKRQMVGLATVQGGLTDSTRNMIRSYASVFALFQGTNAIKKVGQDFQGIEASMLAVSGSAPAAAEDMQFLNSVVDEMGLNLKDTTDAYVKFKFAAKGKMGQTEIEDLFTNISMFGTALKVAPEDMKRAQRA